MSLAPAKFSAHMALACTLEFDWLAIIHFAKMCLSSLSSALSKHFTSRSPSYLLVLYLMEITKLLFFVSSYTCTLCARYAMWNYMLCHWRDPTGLLLSLIHCYLLRLWHEPLQNTFTFTWRHQCVPYYSLTASCPTQTQFIIFFILPSRATENIITVVIGWNAPFKITLTCFSPLAALWMQCFKETEEEEEEESPFFSLCMRTTMQGTFENTVVELSTIKSSVHNKWSNLQITVVNGASVNKILSWLNQINQCLHSEPIMIGMWNLEMSGHFLLNCMHMWINSINRHKGIHQNRHVFFFSSIFIIIIILNLRYFNKLSFMQSSWYPPQ